MTLHDASFSQLLSTYFELRFDQDYELTVLREQREEGWKHERERDERKVRDDYFEGNAGINADLAGAERAGVNALEIAHSRIAKETRVYLRVADIEGGNGYRAALKEAIGKATRRRADIQASLAGGVYREGVQRRFEL